jgi:hypothetical protein
MATLSRVLRIAACGLALAVPATTATVALAPSVASAADVPYIDCHWTPYDGAWACALPSTFKQGRFTPPPDYRQDATSIENRHEAWAMARAAPGARSHGHLGVFLPTQDGWMFVPGNAWSPGDPVFVPHKMIAKSRTAKSRSKSGG